MCIDEKWSTVISLAVPSLQNVKIHPHHPLKYKNFKDLHGLKLSQNFRCEIYWPLFLGFRLLSRARFFSTMVRLI